ALKFDYDKGGSPNGVALEQANIFEAIRAIRRSDQFKDPSHLKGPTVAIVDSGFEPAPTAEFQSSAGASVIKEFFHANSGIPNSGPLLPNIYPSITDYDVQYGHGTAI